MTFSQMKGRLNGGCFLSYFLLFPYCVCKGWGHQGFPENFLCLLWCGASSGALLLPEPGRIWHSVSQGPWHSLPRGRGQRIPASAVLTVISSHLRLGCSSSPKPQHICWLRGTTAKQPNKPKQLVLIRILACLDNALNLHVGTTTVFLGKCMHLCSTQQLNPLFSSWKGFPGYPLSDGFQVPRSCLLSGLEILSHGARCAPIVCHVWVGTGHEGHPPSLPRCPQSVEGVQGSRSFLTEQRCLPRLPSPAPSSSKTPRVQRHFMLTERFSARNLRLNKLESSPRRKQKVEGEELALSCTARSWCTLEKSQVRSTSNPGWPRFTAGSPGAFRVLMARLLHTPKAPEVLSSARELLRLGFTVDARLFSIFIRTR